MELEKCNSVTYVMYVSMCVYMGVSKNIGTPKWMVYKGKPYKMDDLGVLVPLFLETPICACICRYPP